MTKFEEILRKIKPRKKFLEFNAGITYWYCLSDLIQKFGNWHSDEEFQELKEEYSNQADSILLMLEEIGSLKSQLQQRALPVVPEWLDIEIKHFKSTSKHPTVDIVFGVADAIVAVKNGNTHSKLYDYLFCGKQDVCNQHQAIFALAFITGKYEVEKPQLFYLKHIDMSKTNEHYDYYLSKNPKGNIGHSGIGKGKLPKLKCILKLTQQEIDSMQTGSYEQIEVAE